MQQGIPWLHKRNLRGTRLQRRRGLGGLRGLKITARHTNLVSWCIGRARRSEFSSVPRDLDTSGDRTSSCSRRMMRGCIRCAFQILRYAAAVHTVHTIHTVQFSLRWTCVWCYREVLSRRWISIREALIWIIDHPAADCQGPISPMTRKSFHRRRSRMIRSNTPHWSARSSVARQGAASAWEKTAEVRRLNAEL